MIKSRVLSPSLSLSLSFFFCPALTLDQLTPINLYVGMELPLLSLSLATVSENVHREGGREGGEKKNLNFYPRLKT